jgi:hypothetical protein
MVENGNYSKFQELTARFLHHSKLRKDFIERMDYNLNKIEDARLQRIRDVFSKYSENIFNVCYLPRPTLEKLFDEEILVIIY